MVVPSEVVYGPGGEKINKGIAYTALDGRMSSSFKIPISSSYQEEVEARRLKRERAMMRSKMMRPDLEKSALTLGGSSGGNSGSRMGRSKTDSTRGIGKLSQGNTSGHTKSISHQLSNGANISGKRKSLGEKGDSEKTKDKDKDKDGELRSRGSSLTASNGLSPQSSVRSILVGSSSGAGFSSHLIKLPPSDPSSTLRSTSRDKGGASIRQSFRRGSINSMGSLDSVH